MKNSMFLYALNVLVILSLASCSDDSTRPNDVPKFSDSGKRAIVLVIEDLHYMGMDDISDIEAVRDKALPILAEMYEVPLDSIKDMPLEEIVATYNNSFMIKGCVKAAQGKYDRIVVLTGSTATEASLIDSLKELTRGKYCVDMLFSLHGGDKLTCFYDKDVATPQLTQDIRNAGVKIRALYQTCCYAKSTISDWERIGVYAVNGADGLNGIIFFSPILFIEEWTGGKSFEEAVFDAYNRDIEKVRSFDAPDFPISLYLLNEHRLAESKQNVGGSRPDLLWKEIPEKI